MTTRTVYIPRLIESAEQAEALPEGTVATHPLRWAREKVEGLWQVEEETYDSEHMIGFAALVPIEAEEETNTRWDEGDPVNARTRKHRLVTPWRAAQ